MSEQLDRSKRDFSKFDSMTTEALQQILRLDAMRPEGEESDTEELLYIMEVLADRRRNDINYTGKTPQQAFDDFQKYYMPEVSDDDAADTAPANQKKYSVLWIRRIASVAAALAIVFLTTITANAFGFDLFGKVAKWSEEFFHFESQTEPTTIADPDINDQAEYTSLQTALDSYKITQKLAPTWLPMRYELFKIEYFENPNEQIFHSKYYGESESDELSITIRRALDGPPLNIEKNEHLIEIYSVNDIAYYIFQNQGIVHACWIVDNFECLIVCKLPIDTVKEIIDSI